MISVRLGADVLMNATFAISPLAQMAFQLNFGRVFDGAEERPLLTAICREARNHVPGFLFAHTVSQGSLAADLRDVASTPGDVVARQLERFLSMAQEGRDSVSQDSRRIMTFLAAGERAFARRAAWELGQFWSQSMAAGWNAVRSQMEGDIRHRAASMAGRGLSATLNSLHPAFSYDSGVLSIRDERTWSLIETRRIVLHPSPLVTTWMLQDDPWGENGLHLAYPIGAGEQSDPPAERFARKDRLGQVIGEARQLLLADLGNSRTTTELAERHHMSASTVSYHLLRLHRVGLLNRTREGSRVYYQRTPEADRLVARDHKAASVPPPVNRVPSQTRRFVGA